MRNYQCTMKKYIKGCSVLFDLVSFYDCDNYHKITKEKESEFLLFLFCSMLEPRITIEHNQ